ncbi:hypothetical protein A3862_04150 [Methylobacterium sp. XJLW]|uniref:hypothetical protein n=1 Tax=Methylobacterium sp. XJLW TaxID=739141 RepID=UPI000DAAE3AA|nr:hypothetical protein [Methylobacterium sp. XJLW]AWV14791.1 hypothetical protein A3862_04150 [Methylobacterium sp. XJLW]
MSETTIDTAIAAWKAATTKSGRDVAAEAIEQHIAHRTPEDGDYQAATAELLARLEAEAGPLGKEPGVYDDDTLLDGDARLPHVFVHLDGMGNEARYWYIGLETYEVHDYDRDRRAWIGRGTNRYADDTTVEDFLALQDVD